MIMKKISITLLCAALCLAGCSKDDLEVPGGGGTPGTDGSEAKVTVAAATYVSPSAFSEDMRRVLDARFPNRTSLADARIAFFTDADLASMREGIDALYDRGGLVVLAEPDRDAYSAFAGDYDHPDVMPAYADGTEPLLFAYTGRTVYSIQEHGHPEEENGEADGDEVAEDEFTQEELSRMEDEAPEVEPSENGEACDHGYDYLNERFDPFVDWVNTRYAAGPLPAAGGTRASSESYSSTVDISNNYYEFFEQYTVSLHNKIRKVSSSKPDYLNCDGDITVYYKIHQVYQYACNSQHDAKGDYYLVEGNVTAHNRDMWKCEKHTHGGIHTYIVGYFMTGMNVKFELLDEQGNPIPDLRFYVAPQPQSVNESVSYSHSSTHEFNAALSGGFSLALGYRGSWTNTVSQQLDDVRTRMYTSPNAVVNYEYKVQNIRHNKQFTKSKEGKGYPDLSRDELICPATWAWKVPYGSAGVEDDSESCMQMRITVSTRYGTYSWYGGLSDSGSAGSWSGGKRTFTHKLDDPYRKRFGVLALKNAANNTVAGIRVWRREDAADAEAYAVIPSSYNVNETARIKLPVGTYRIRYNTVDPNDGNKLLGIWEYDNIEVTMGGSAGASTIEEASTTEVSTVDAVRVE